MNRPRAVKNIDIITLLKCHYPDSIHCTLNHKDAFELLVSTILAAQSTDRLINTITPGLFKKYKGIVDFASADLEVLETDIRSTGFFRNKSKSIIGASREILKSFNGRVPNNMKDLLTLPGVGRKTANVVLGECFGKQVIIVDTHMKRISHHIGLTGNTDPGRIESDLLKIIPEDIRTNFSHMILAHGRAVCIARRPRCSQCPILKYCMYGQKNL